MQDRSSTHERARCTCRVCGSTDVGPSVRFPAEALVHCSRCDADSLAGELDTRHLYSQAYFQGEEYFSYLEDEAVHRLNADRKIARLLRHSRPPRVVVEVGCAYGFFLRRVSERFPDATCIGIDVDPGVIEAARSRGGNVQYFTIAESDAFLAAARRAPVDWFVAWDTFEHLPSAELLLRTLREVSSPRTLCAVTTLDAGGLLPRVRGTRWRQFHPPTHLIYPTRKTFAFLARDQRWDVLAHESFGYYRALRQYLAVAAKVLPERFRPAFRRILMKPVWGRGFYLNLFDIDLVMFRTTGAAEP